MNSQAEKQIEQPDTLTLARVETQHLLDELNRPEPDVFQLRDVWYSSGRVVTNLIRQMLRQLPPDADLRGRK